MGLYFAKHPLCEIFDRVVGPAFHEIGARWECDDAEIYQTIFDNLRKSLFLQEGDA